MAMSEDEYWDSDPEFDDEGQGEFGDTFLSEEESDGYINMVAIPRLDFDAEEFIRSYLKVLRKCKTNDEAFNVLYGMFAKTQLMSIITNASNDIQNRVSDLEDLIEEYRL